MAVAHGSSHTGTSVDSNTVTVTGVTGGAGTFLCWVDSRQFGDTVSSVAGGGLTWSQVGADQSSMRQHHTLRLYKAQGTPNANPFDVTVTFSDATGTRLVVVQRLTGSGGDHEGYKRRNVLGDSGGTNTGGSDTAPADITLSTSGNPDSLVVVAFAPRGATINASGRQAGYTSRVENLNANTLGELIRLYVFEKAAPSLSEPVSMPLSGAADWVTMGLVLMPPSSAVIPTRTLLGVGL